MTGDPCAALDVRGLVKHYGEFAALDDVSLSVVPGETVCVVGPNGSGKTTLVECIEGIRQPDRGTIRLLGEEYRTGDRRPSRLGVQLQEESLPARIRVGEAVDLFADLYGTKGIPDDFVRLLDLGDIWKQKFDTLSGGQKRRVVVGLALVGDPDLVILDEPSSGLDPVGQGSVERLVAELCGRGCAVCMTVHDMEQAQRVADRVALMSRGRILADGSPSTLVELLGSSHCMEIPNSQGEPIAATHGLRRITGEARTYLYGSYEQVQAVARTLDADHANWSLRAVSLLDVYLIVAAGEPLAASQNEGGG